MSDPFKEVERWDAFISELRELVDKYSEFANAMRENLEDDEDEEPAIHPSLEFRADSPIFMSGIILLVSHTNMDNWSDLHVVIPRMQNRMMSIGMMHEALEIM